MAKKTNASGKGGIVCPDSPEWERQMSELSKKATAGDKEARVRLRACLEKERNRLEKIDWSQMIRRDLLGYFSDAGTVELLLMKANALQRELLSENPSPIERLLVERVVTCWVHLQTVETVFAQRDARGMTFTAATFWQKTVERAQKRYLSAIKALAYVGRLLRLPPVQVNIGILSGDGQGVRVVDTNAHERLEDK